MGFGSPLVGAKDIATITGYYILHGCKVEIQDEIRPVALDNVIIDRRPAYFELFPASDGTAHASIILPSRQHIPGRSIKGELNFILGRSHYAKKIIWDPARQMTPYFGIIPVGRLRKSALDRIVFFGEAGQANPATSATALTRMLHTYKEMAQGIVQCLKMDDLRQASLLRAFPPSMTRMNRGFQETLFESMLSFSSDDFRRLVQDLQRYPNEVINDLIFADFDFRTLKTPRLAMEAILNPGGVLGTNVMKSFVRFFMRRA
jgi:hypothetical protein